MHFNVLNFALCVIPNTEKNDIIEITFNLFAILVQLMQVVCEFSVK